MNFDIRLWGFTSILKAITVLFLLHFDSCPAEAMIIWLTKQLNTLSNQSFTGIFVKLFGQKSRKFPRKTSAVEPCLIQLHDNVSKANLRYSLFPRIFPMLEQLFCRANVSISSISLDDFLNREALLSSLLELATYMSTNVLEKGFIGNVTF